MATPVLPNNPDNYIIPSAISVWFAPLKDDGTLDEYFDLGNVFDISLNLADEYLDHESARNGLLAPDKTVITKLDGEIKFMLDEMVGKNLILAFRPAIAPDEAAVYEVLDQKRIRLFGTTARIIDRRAVEADASDYLLLNDVVVRSADGTVTYVDGVDYTFTQTSGTGTGLTPATIARIALGGIADGAEVVVSYKYDRETTMYRIQTGAILEGAMKIQTLNLIGPLCAYLFPFVSIKIDGEMTINPSEWMKQGFNCKILTDGTGNRGEFYLFDRFNKLSVV